MRLFGASVRKLLPRLVTWLSLILLVAVLVLIFVSVGAVAPAAMQQPGGEGVADFLTFPGAYEQVVLFILGLGGLLAVIYGAAVAGSEWGWGTLKAAVARGESRTRYILVTFAAVALLMGIGFVIAFAAGVGAAVLGATIAGIPLSGISDADALRELPLLLARGWLAMAAQGAIGFAVATLARSQIAGISVGIGLYFAEQFAAIFFSGVVRFLPFSAAQAAVVEAQVPTGPGVPQFEVLTPDVALLVVAGWLVLAMVVSAVFTERAEING